MWAPGEYRQIDPFEAVQHLADATKGEMVMTAKEFEKHIVPLLICGDFYLLVDQELRLLHQLAQLPQGRERTAAAEQKDRLQERQKKYEELNKLKRRGGESSHASFDFVLLG